MFSLEGKTALITGASGGIGSSIAKALKAQGAKLVISGTRVERLEALKAELGGDDVHVIACNLRDKADVEKLAAEAEKALGHIDILVNNAGLTRDTLLMRMKDEDWDDVLHVNLTSTFILTRAVLKGMMKRRAGRVIGITSVVGVTGNPGQTNYAASKAAMIGFSKSLAGEVATRNITINCVAPGFIETAMTEELPEKVKESILSSIPARRMGTSDEIASSVVYLASDEAQYITGQTIHVNGGMAMI